MKAILLFFLITTSLAQNCYFINQNVATNDVPCNVTGGISTCCNKNDICLSNGLCYLQGSDGPSFARGSCTDKNWRGICNAAKPCANRNPRSGYRVVNAVGNKYCCGNVMNITGAHNENIKCDSDFAFNVKPGNVIPGVAALNATNTGNSASNKNGKSSNNSNDKSARLGLGLGLGLPLGIIAASALIWGVWERKQRAISAKEVQDLKASAAAAGVAHGQYGYGYAVPGQVAQAPFVQPVELENVSSSLPSELDSRAKSQHK